MANYIVCTHFDDGEHIGETWDEEDDLDKAKAYRARHESKRKSVRIFEILQEIS
jgi:hypothetical protein